MQKLINTFLVALILFVVGITFSATNFSAQKSSDNLLLSFLDVGQGDAILFNTPQGNQILIDGGPSEYKLSSQLRKAMPITDKKIELLIISHNHSDHIGGLRWVINNYKVEKILLSGAVHTTEAYINLLKLIKDKGISTEAVKVGRKISFDNLNGIVLTPLTDFSTKTPTDQHEANVTTFWQYYSTSFLLTGDMESALEGELLRKNLLKKSDILKVGHHGSETSSSLEFIKYISPKIAVIQVGKDNKFDHPRQVVLDRLSSLNIPILRTDQKGTIIFEINEGGFTYR